MLCLKELIKIEIAYVNIHRIFVYCIYVTVIDLIISGKSFFIKMTMQKISNVENIFIRIFYDRTQSLVILILA